MKWLTRIATAGTLVAFTCSAQTSANLTTHGTINTLLGNSKEMVLLTDSRGTYSNGQYGDNKQKLFQLDDKTMVSLAGYVASPGPRISNDTANKYPLLLATASMVEAYSAELSNSANALSFNDKVVGLSDLAEYLLDNLNAANLATSGHTAGAPADLELIFAGYDIDGSLKCTKRVLTFAPTSTSEDPNRPRASVRPVEASTNGSLRYLVSGPPDAKRSVTLRLAEPTLPKFRTERKLLHFRRACVTHKTGNLSLQEMTAVAKYLESVASSHGIVPGSPSSVIGGDVQLATFSNGSVSFHPFANLQRYPGLFSKNIVLDSNLNRTLAPSPLPSATYINANCVGDGTPYGGKIFLDNAVILSGRFEDCTFFFDGDLFYKSPQVIFKGGTLVIGPHMCDQSKSLLAVRKLLPGIKEVWWNNYPLDRTVQSIVWEGGRSQCGLEDVVIPEH